MNRQQICRVTRELRNELYSTRRPLWPLDSFAQLGAPDQVRRSREVSVGTYTLWRCMPLWTTETRVRVGRLGPEKNTGGTDRFKAEAPRDRGHRAGSEQSGPGEAKLVL